MVPENPNKRQPGAAHALRYAAMGYAVHPVDANKHPMTAHGHLDATTDAETITSWWITWPTANVAITTAGLVVVDCDPGAEAWVSRDWADAPSARTPRGGRHYYYSRPAGKSWRCSAGRLAPNVDTRTDGGFVLAPPSETAAGAYAWLPGFELPARDQLPEPPAWLIDALDQAAAAPTTSATTDEEPILEGQRNARLASMAGSMRKAGFGAREIEASLRIVNAERCAPPLADEEVRSIAASVARYAINPPLLAQIITTGRIPTEPAEPDYASASSYQPFPVDALPATLARFAREAATALGCDPAYVALPALAAVFGAIGNSRRLLLKRSWSEPAVAWFGIVGKSGTLKSPAQESALAPLDTCEASMAATYREEAKQYRRDRERYKEKVREARKSGHELPETPERPVRRRVLINDITIESLAEVLADNPHGLLLYREELAGWLGSFSRYRGRSAIESSDLQSWLTIHGARSLRVDRKTGERRLLTVPHAAVSVVGGIQPGILTRCLSGAYFEAGLAARILLAMPPGRPKRWTDADIAPETTLAYGGLLQRLLALSMSTGEHGPEPFHVRMAPDARVLWTRFYDDWAWEQWQADGDLAAAFAKLEAYSARFALVHHVVNQVASGQDDADRVTPASVEAAIALTCWFGAEAERVYQMLGEQPGERATGDLLAYIRRRGGQIGVRELQRSNRRRYPTAEAAEATLNSLVPLHGHWRHHATTETGGRPTNVFVLHDSARQPTQPDFPAG
jgi:hypothetical protein